MSLQDIINKSVNDTVNQRLFIKMIIETLQYIYDFLCWFYHLCHNSLTRNDTMKKDTHKDIHLFLLNIADKWNNNTIDNVELGSDIIYLFNRYSDKQKREINVQDNDMKYYMLGWYIYQTINDNTITDH
jgi:hypothetical protein